MIDLAKRIREMYKYCTEDVIAATLNIPVGTIKGILSGELADDVLAAFDPARAIDIRIVEQKHFLRSSTVGIVSTGGCGATTVAASLAFTLTNDGQPVSVADLNEYGTLTSLLKLKKPALTPTILGWARGSGLDFISVPIKKNLNAMLAVNNLQEYLNVMPGKLGSLIHAAGNRYPLTIVDCPGIPQLWEEVFSELDTAVWVIRADYSSLNALLHLANSLRPMKSRTFLLFNMIRDHQFVSQCRSLAEKLNLPVLGFIPYISGLEELNNKGANPEKILLSYLAPLMGNLVKAISPLAPNF